MDHHAAGWRDRMKDKPFDKRYADWTPLQQQAYEEGRREAAVAKYHKLDARKPIEIWDLPKAAFLDVSAERTIKRNPRG